jgi:N utilization substance protein A
MKTELTLAFNEITERFGLSPETVMEALESAMISAYRRSVNASSAQSVQAKIDLESGGVRIFAEKEVVESVENPLTEVSVEEALKAFPEAQIGETVVIESTPTDFGRVAAQTAKQVILQRLREAEREAQFEEFVDREGDMVHGTVHSITPQTVTVGLGRAEAILPRNQQIPGEHFRVRDRIRVYVLEVRKSSRGPVIVVSRRDPNMLRRLLEMEVPEINQGMVEIKAIAREAGKRAKVAVAAMREGVDPVGACVGMRGVRIQSIVRDLNDEKIDVIEWNPNQSVFIAKALSPARVSGVFLDEDPARGKTAMVVVPEDQLSLAIGRAGVNARLAARLTGWRIDIKSLPEAASDSLNLIEADPLYEDLATQEAETIPKIEAILTKKAENRPVTPEEYQVLAAFVDQVQGEVHGRKQAERQKRQEKLAEIRAKLPPPSYTTELEEVGLSTRFFNILDQAGYDSPGKVMETLALDEDKILGLSGIGPKAMKEITQKGEELLERLREEYQKEVEALAKAEAEAKALAEAEAAAEEAAELVEVAEAEAEPAVEAEEELAVEQPVPEEVAAAVEAEPAEPEAEEAPPEEEVEAEEPAVEFTLEEMLKTEEVLPVAEGEEEELDAELHPAKKGKRRKPGTRVVEYDPERGEMVVKRRRKRGEPEDWEDYGEI